MFELPDDDLVIIPEIPWGVFPEPVDPWLTPIDPGSIINPQPGRDWVTNPSTAVLFDGVLVGADGRLGVKVLPGGAAAGDIPVTVRPGSGLAAGAAVVLDADAVRGGAKVDGVAGGLSVIGGGGFNAALAQQQVMR